MAYLPKSKTKIKFANSEELLYVDDLSPYPAGEYIKTTTGRLYAGTNHLNLEQELKLNPVEKIMGTSNHFLHEKTIDVQIHNVLKPLTDEFTSNTSVIKQSKPYPTEKDYLLGFYTRYFSKRINGFKYIEINKETYESLRDKKDKYDYILNEIGKLNWHLTDNVFKKNTISIKQKARTFLGIQNLFPVLNEFYREINDPIPQNNLNTTGKELYYNDGKEYIGLYHIHPEKGPMVGAQHTPLNHAKLYYSNQLPKVMGSEYEDFINGLDKTGDSLLIIDKRPIKIEKGAAIEVKQVEVKQQTTSTPSYSGGSSGGGSSGGGGGGY